MACEIMWHACKTKTKHFEYACFSDKKRDFDTDDNIRFIEAID